MQHPNNQYAPGNYSAPSFIYLLLAISGISFCFFLGFPFDNQYESYLWVIEFNKVSLGDTLTKQLLGGIETFRPLGMANAWLGYKLSGNIYLQQILNWLFAISSFTLLFRASGNRILFSMLSFITGACFFSGYIYLFHLHGVFYGPFQLYVSVLVWIAAKHRTLSSGMLAMLSVLTVFVCLYHTFALLVFCAFLVGYLLQLSKTEKRIKFIRIIILIVLTALLAKIILQTKQMKSVQALTDGLLVSFRLAEINRTLSVISIALVLLTLLPLAKSSKQQLVITTGTLLVAALLMIAHIPVLMLWVTACIVKTLTERNIVMAALIAATAILPLGSSSGSPTYVIFVLLVCTYVTATNKTFFIPDTALLKKFSITIVCSLLICLIAIKAGWQVPVVSALARPVLAEQEKTKQLTNIIDWKLNNRTYATFQLVFYDSVEIPVFAKNAVNRINRPVTMQENLDAYFDFLSNDMRYKKKSPALYITFGNKMLEDKQLVFSVNGNWNGPACVFR